MDDKNNFAILALVAIVAVVGLVVLFSGGKQATSVASLPSAAEEANIGGQLTRGCNLPCQEICGGFGECWVECMTEWCYPGAR